MTHALAGLTVLMWHYVRDADEQPAVGAGRVDPTAFDAQLDSLGRDHSIIGWADVAAALAGRRSLPPDACLLTFDDGVVDHHRTVAPRLAARGWPGVFFVLARGPGDGLALGHRIHVLLARRSPDALRAEVLERLGPTDRRRFRVAETEHRSHGFTPIDALKRTMQRELAREAGPILSTLIEAGIGPEDEVAESLYLGPTLLRDLRAVGLTIGGHGREHGWFDWEPAPQARDEVRAAAALLRPLEPRPWAFAYPFGARSAAAARALGRYGFGAGFLASPRGARGRYSIGRLDAEDRSAIPTRTTGGRPG